MDFTISPSSQSFSRRFDDMLVEAEPRSCSVDEANGSQGTQGPGLIVSVLNRAWQAHREDPDGYAAWEAATIRELLGVST
jgi:hypothetical protein